MENQTRTVEIAGDTYTVLVRGTLKYVENFDALSPSGEGVAKNCGPYATGDHRRLTPRWQAFRDALLSRDPARIAATARPLRSVRVRVDSRHPMNPNYGFTVSLGSWCLFCAPVVVEPA